MVNLGDLYKWNYLEDPENEIKKCCGWKYCLR